MFGPGHDINVGIGIMDHSSFGSGKIGARRFKVIDEHLYSDLKDEAVVLNLVNGKYYGLNCVGVAIWKELQSPVTIGEIESAIIQEFDVDQERCHREILAFLGKMTEETLVEIIDD
jgi:Coenzyme PQQ synthesis protein D (PqqD)